MAKDQGGGHKGNPAPIVKPATTGGGSGGNTKDGGTPAGGGTRGKPAK